MNNRSELTLFLNQFAEEMESQQFKEFLEQINLSNPEETARLAATFLYFIDYGPDNTDRFTNLASFLGRNAIELEPKHFAKLILLTNVAKVRGLPATIQAALAEVIDINEPNFNRALTSQEISTKELAPALKEQIDVMKRGQFEKIQFKDALNECLAKYITSLSIYEEFKNELRARQGDLFSKIAYKINELDILSLNTTTAEIREKKLMEMIDNYFSTGTIKFELDQYKQASMILEATGKFRKELREGSGDLRLRKEKSKILISLENNFKDPDKKIGDRINNFKREFAENEPTLKQNLSSKGQRLFALIKKAFTGGISKKFFTKEVPTLWNNNTQKKHTQKIHHTLSFDTPKKSR